MATPNPSNPPSPNSHPTPPWADTSPEAFDKEVCDLVVAVAPRIFAVVQEREVDQGVKDGWVAAWGMAFEDGSVRVTAIDGNRQFVLNTPERALRWFTGRRGGEDQVSARLVWLGQAEAADFERAEAA
ncbi:hypothetical protein [Streptomyces sparsogenes]|uniref:Uncharacterized protein n=1 Tax=Streptomyces sparsogenes DSM 40356 TaxID=1331668 RepID=A0A1R1SRT6_9ACTN|nr:hypothetical protein [Streptomyces sparsogenes]OMI41004.1 hypothetical protein SPAR_03091 [Streptomyces sparsogenes DSM 40356]